MIQTGLSIILHRVMTSITVERQNVLKWLFHRSTSLGQQLTIPDFTIKLAKLTVLGTAAVLRLLVLARTAPSFARFALGFAPTLVAAVPT